MIHSRFVRIYREKGSFAALASIASMDTISIDQFRHDRNVLYGMMQSVFRKGKARRYVRRHAPQSDSIRVFDDIIREYSLGGGIATFLWPLKKTW